MIRIMKWLDSIASLFVRHRWLVGGLVVLAALLCSAHAFARAGGGGNYTGGGGGGSGGGGDGIGALIYLAIAYPEVGVPLLIVVIVVGIVKNRLNPDRTTARAVKKLEHIGAPSTSGLEGIRQRDPGFDSEAFLAKITKVDAAVQDAWCRGDMLPVRTFLSDGLLRRFAAQLSIIKYQGIRNAMADHQIIKSHIHAVEQDTHFDTIHVAMEATARDVEVSADLSYEEAMKLAAKARKETYTEIWSFLRRPGAKTLTGGGAVDGYCPSCGAPIQMGQATRCEHCEVLINSGDYDWVLAEITQPIEWRPSSTGTVRGIEELSSRDPGFNRQAAEDRGSYVFWRWVEALVTADVGPLAKCASPEMKARMVDQVKGGPAALFKTAVGSVDLVACEVGADGGRDHYYAKVLWSSARSGKAAPAPSGNVLMLGRKAGATDSGGLSYARCPECQGPLGENDAPTCEYCGADLSAGNADWVLDAVLRQEEMRVSSAGQQPVAGTEDVGEIPVWATPDMGNPRERTLLLMRMAAVVMADGVVTKQEHKLLKSASKRWAVPIESIKPILEGQVDPETLSTMRPSNPDGFLSGLVSAALIDGRIDSKEEKLLLDVARNLGISDADSRNMMNNMAKMVSR